VVLKTARAAVGHKSDVGGVVLGLAGPAEIGAAYRDLAARLGPEAVVSPMVAPGVELSIGLARDPHLGLLVVVGAGGVLVEVLRDRAVGLPPLDAAGARRLLDRLAVRPVLDGVRGAGPVDLAAVVDAIVGLATMASELGDVLDAVDVNPLVCGPAGVVAVDVLMVSRRR
jgi:hypothetical protein